MKIADLQPRTWSLNKLITEQLRRDAFDMDAYLKDSLANGVRAKGWEPLSDTFKVSYHREHEHSDYLPEAHLARVTCLAVYIREDVPE